jgi:hypothetical protein
MLAHATLWDRIQCHDGPNPSSSADKRFEQQIRIYRGENMRGLLMNEDKCYELTNFVKRMISTNGLLHIETRLT